MATERSSDFCQVDPVMNVMLEGKQVACRKPPGGIDPGMW
jgi:hypothetical protein